MDNDEIVSGIHTELLRMRSYCFGSRRISFALPTSENDARIICESLTVWSGMLLDLIIIVPRLASETKSQRGRYRHMAYRAAVDVASHDLVKSFSFLDSVTSIVIDSVRHCPGTFKGYQLPIREIKQISIESSCPRALSDLIIYLMRTMLTPEGNEEGDHGSLLNYFLAIVRFFKKLPLDRCDLVESMEIEYLQDEQRLSEVAAGLSDPETLGWIDEMKLIVQQELKDFEISDLCPRHGPGRVADDHVKTIFSKYGNMRNDARIGYLLRKHDLGTQEDFSPWLLSEKSTRRAKFICVPKTWKTLRGISAEPTELQFYQQAILYSLDRYFHKSPFFSQRIDLHNQCVNQELSKIGSIDQSLATIDLSKASDSVSLALVREVFKGTNLLLWLLATRSTSVELPSGVVIKTNKFAPMGSSVCFPIECILFVLIAEVARRRTLRMTRSESFLAVPRVYGDDIVCSSASVPQILDGLSRLGFLPNKAKSYWDGFYRESCGKEYWCGQDVSPLFFRAKVATLDSHSTTYDELSSLQQLYNSLYLRGFNHARRYVLSQLMRKTISLGKRKFLVSNLIVRTFEGNMGTIASCYPTNFSAKISRSDALQCSVITKLSWTRKYCRRDQLKIDPFILGDIMYHQWFLDRLRVDPDCKDLPDSQVDPYSRTPIGYEMIPSIKKVPLWTFDDLSAFQGHPGVSSTFPLGGTVLLASHTMIASHSKAELK